MKERFFFAASEEEMIADIHGHTKWSGEGSPNNYNSSIERALALGVDIIAFTEHSFPGGNISLRLGILAKTLKERRQKELESPIVILGEEVSTLEGHILILGFDPDADSIKGIPSFRSAEETVKRAHDRGLLVVAPHLTEKQTFASLSRNRAIDLAEKHDGFWNGIQTTDLRKGIDFKALIVADLLNVPGYGGSDFHRDEEVAMAGMYLPRNANLKDWQSIMDYFRTNPTLNTFVRRISLPPSQSFFLKVRSAVNSFNGR